MLLGFTSLSLNHKSSHFPKHTLPLAVAQGFKLRVLHSLSSPDPCRGATYSSTIALHSCARFRWVVVTRPKSYSELLPLNCSAWFWGEVIQDAVYAFDFACDSFYYMLHQFEWDILYCCCHCIYCVYGSDDYWPLKAS